MRFFYIALLLFSFLTLESQTQSIARKWNEALLTSIRKDLARPTVTARNLFHISAAAYDAWCVFDTISKPYFLGNSVGGFNIPFNGFTITNREAQRDEAISYAMYRLMLSRYRFSPEGQSNLRIRLNALMSQLGYDINITGVNYANGSAAELGNYIAARIIAYGNQDGSREQQLYSNAYYQPVNPSLIVTQPGNKTVRDPNRWQSLTLTTFIDQNGNVFPGATPSFLSAEWGNVIPFSLTNADKTTYTRNGNNYNVYLDPGPPEFKIDTNDVAASVDYKRTFSTVLQWSSHLGVNDGVTIDISPNTIGNSMPMPNNASEYASFYDNANGGTADMGYSVNPVTGQPYAPNVVLRGDYTRVLAEFWADGPDSETPPGHWFTLFNYVTDHPMFVRKYKGKGEVVDPLEWDVRGYFMLGGALHDVAVSIWGIKGYYDAPRPIAAIRYMAMKGQCTDPNLPHYHKAGLELIPGFIELVGPNDPLAGPNGININKIKVKAWKAHPFITTPTDVADVDWILGESWWPYQRPTFVTPPFAGYLSGHSTYSRAAAEVLSDITGSEYFPGGLGEFVARKNQYLVFEEGPSEDIHLQWATYRDAADQSALSRIWGGIHPPMDDIRGRKIGIQIAEKAVAKAETLFFVDNDNDGFLNYEDCNDNDPNINPDAMDECDMIDNNCNGLVDDSGNCGARFSGVAFVDSNYDGQQNSNENTLKKVLIKIYKEGNVNKVITTLTTDENGEYLSEPILEPGNYFLEFDVPIDYGFTKGDIGNDDSDSDVVDKERGRTLAFEINENVSNIQNISAGFYECTNVGELVWYDIDKDDIADNTENGINGIIVEIFRNENGSYTFFDSYITGQKPNSGSDDGYFNFCVPPGQYYIRVNMPPYGLVPAMANVGNNDNIDSDITRTFGPGTTNTFNVTFGNDIKNISAGFYPMATVGNLVWLDENANGVQESYEEKLPNVKVEAYDENHELINYAYTNEDGIYNIDYLGQQDYYLKFYPPSGYSSTISLNENNEINSDITHEYGAYTTSMVTLTSGEDKINIDAGFALGVLPVTWKYFTGKASDKVNVLTWATGSELNASKYQVERSIDGENFEVIGEVVAKNSQLGANYSYTDTKLNTNVSYYYRLSQLDFDGKGDKSNIVFVERKSHSIDFKFINPSQSNFEIVSTKSFTMEDGVVLKIYNEQGILIVNQVMQGSIFKTKNLPSGLYMIQMNEGGNIISKKGIIIE